MVWPPPRATLVGRGPFLRAWNLGDEDAVEGALSSLRLVQDHEAHEAAADYWEMSEEAHRAIVESLERCGDEDLLTALDAFRSAPDDKSATARFRDLLRTRLSGTAPVWSDVRQAVWRAEGISRLAAHTGERLAAGGPRVDVDDLVRLPADHGDGSRPGTDAPGIVVVVPFRDRTPTRSRLRNLLACLRSLGDQTAPRSDYRVVVVEADATPRWAGLVRDRADAYLHLPWDGHFNKAWAVNAGVVRAGDGVALVCVLDADVLVDRDFVRRNAARFGRRGAQAHLPYHDALCLDGPSSHHAVRRRVLDRRPEADPAELRGVLLRRPPGHCVWVRRDLFDRVGGFDERFFGWGGEDLDFVFRLDAVATVDRFDDALLHLWHERPATQENGRRFYAGRTLLSWRPVDPVGRLDAPARSADDDLAGLIERRDGALVDG